MDHSAKKDDGEPSYKHSKTMVHTWHSLLLKLDPIGLDMYVLAYDKFDRTVRGGRHAASTMDLLFTLLEAWGQLLGEGNGNTKSLQDSITSTNAPKLYTTTFDTATMQTLRVWLKEYTTPYALSASMLPPPPGMARPTLPSQSTASPAEAVRTAAEPPEGVDSPCLEMQQVLQRPNGVQDTPSPYRPRSLFPSPTPSRRSSTQSLDLGSVTRTDNVNRHIHLASSNSGNKVIKLETYNWSDVKDTPAEDWDKSKNSCQCLVLAEESSEVWRLAEQLREAIEKMLEGLPDYEYRKRRSNCDV